MKEWIVDKKEAGGRLDKYLKARLKEAPDSFFYKMARKKNLTLNGAKCKGNELLKEGDTVRLYVSDATIALFEGNGSNPGTGKGSAAANIASYKSAYSNLKDIEVLKETDDLIFLYKPSGILSQKAKEDDESLNEWLIGYLLKCGKLTEEDLKAFVPSVLNRLDRNTSGIVIGSKTLRGSRFGSELIREGIIRKFYFCLVDAGDYALTYGNQITGTTGAGNAPSADNDCYKISRIILSGFLFKDEASNKVSIYRTEEAIPASEKKDVKPVSITVKEIAKKDGISLLEVELHSGKSHQIRALLAEYKSPILGDTKYGGKVLTSAKSKTQSQNGIGAGATSGSGNSRGQCLCAARVEFPVDADFKEKWMNEYKGLTVVITPNFAADFIS